MKINSDISRFAQEISYPTADYTKMIWGGKKEEFYDKIAAEARQIFDKAMQVSEEETRQYSDLLDQKLNLLKIFRDSDNQLNDWAYLNVEKATMH